LVLDWKDENSLICIQGCLTLCTEGKDPSNIWEKIEEWDFNGEWRTRKLQLTMTIHASSWNQNILLGFLIHREIFEKFGQSDATNQSFTSVNFQMYSLVFEGEIICQERYLCLGWSFMEEDEVKFINDTLIWGMVMLI